MKSLCDTCKQPGRCCKGFVLIDNRGYVWKDINWIERAEERLPPELSMFHPISFQVSGKNEHGQEYGAPRYSCDQLLPNGRCGCYENRPQLCRDFKPASDALCVYVVRAEKSRNVREGSFQKRVLKKENNREQLPTASLEQNTSPNACTSACDAGTDP